MKINSNPIENYRIVIPEAPLPGIHDAAQMLQGVISEALGVTAPIISETEPEAEYEIVIGTSTSRDSEALKEAKSQLADDGYCLLLDGKKLYISSLVPRGVAYGVYAFAEKFLGARHYSSRYSLIHKDRVCDINETVIDNPGFMSRDTFWFDVLHPSADSKYDFQSARFSNHGDMPSLGGGVFYAGGLVHTLSELAEERTEVNHQPCLTNEKTYQTVLKNVRRQLKEKPTAKMISVSQNDSDGAGLGCQCAKCREIDEREGTPMGSLLTFVNRIADDIKEDYPDVWVDTLAYRYTRKAPKYLKPRENVIIRLCSIECCFSHPLSDPDCPQNAAFVRDIEDWARICSHLYIWDYTTNFLFYLAPFPNFSVLRENVAFFKAHNVIGVFEQGNYQSLSGELGELRAYLLSKLLWDPDMTEEEYYLHMNEFLSDYYGEGWQYIREFIDLVCSEAACRHVTIYDHPHAILPFTDKDGNPSNALCEHMISLWDKAYELATDKEKKAHVRTSRIQALCLSTFRGDDPQRLDRIREMHAAIKASGITLFRESTPIPQDAEEALLPLH